MKPFPTVYDCNRGEDPKQGINLIFLNLRKNRRISAGDGFSRVIYVLIGTKVSILSWYWRILWNTAYKIKNTKANLNLGHFRFLIFLFSWAGLLRVWKSIKSNLRGVKSSFKVLLCLNWLIWRQSVSRFRNNILAETAPIEMLTEKINLLLIWFFFVFFRNRYRNRYWNRTEKYLDRLFLLKSAGENKDCLIDESRQIYKLNIENYRKIFHMSKWNKFDPDGLLRNESSEISEEIFTVLTFTINNDESYWWSNVITRNKA